MSAKPERFFLFVGTNIYGDAAVDKAKATGIAVRRKSLYSKPDNWKRIESILRDPLLIGALVKLTPGIYQMIASDMYRENARQLFRSLATVPHVMFIHESILTGEQALTESPDENDVRDDDLFGWDEDSWRRHTFRQPSEEVRTYVGSLLAENGIGIVPYKTNAEMSVLSMGFVDDNDRNLLFRVYVPSGRLYAAEADKLLSLFRDWLTSVGKHSVRQDGYRTAAGQVYEFFGGESLQRAEISREFETFSKFLTNCMENPEAAASALIGTGLSKVAAGTLVARYSKDARRLQLDIRQERESRLLTLRHGLEADLLDAGADSSIPWAEIDEAIESLIPETGNLTRIRLLEPPAAVADSNVTVNYSPQIIHAFQSTVVQNVQGTANLGASAKELMALIGRFGGTETPALQTAVYELEDPDARPADRLGAKHKLKAFILRLGGKVEDVALAVLQKYLETKIIHGL